MYFDRCLQATYRLTFRSSNDIEINPNSANLDSGL